MPAQTSALTPDQLAIGEATREFAREHLAPHAIEWDQTKHFPVDVLGKAAEMGLGGVYVREEHGGSGLSRMDAVVVYEALATGDPSIAGYVSIHNMVAWMIDRYGDEVQRSRYLPGLCSMRELGSYCLTEPGAGSDAAALSTRAVRDGDDYVLDGVKQFISGAGSTHVYIVMARTGGSGPDGISAFVVERDDSGLSFGPNEKKMGWNAQPTRQVVLEGVRIPASRRLGAEGEGFRMAMSGLNGGRLGIAACSLGGAQDALDRTIAYLGRPSGRSYCVRRRSSSSWPTWPPSSKPPAPWCGARPRRWTRANPRLPSCARWPSASPPTSASPWPTAPSSCTAATATSPNTASRR